jgi:ATP-binding cassette subfamily F protein uup
VDQWLAQRGPERRAQRKSKSNAPREKPKKKGLSYLEKREYEAMEETILEAENELEAAAAKLEDPRVASDAEAAHEAFVVHEAAKDRVTRLYHRWAELEDTIGSDSDG